MMQLAEIIYQDQQPLLKLPRHFHAPLYIYQNEQTGQIAISSYLPQWQGFLEQWQQLDGNQWELSRHDAPQHRPLLEDWHE